MEVSEEIKIAIQILIFGLVVVARLHMTSHLARKRVWGFSMNCVAGLCYCAVMIYSGLYILAAMDLVIMCLDARGVKNNLRDVEDGLFRQSEADCDRPN
jgi:hypothetical protein